MAERVAATAKKSEAKQTCSNSCKQNVGFNSSGSTADRILQLQRTAGNQAVQRLIKSGALQAKLRIGQPNDIYEQEADWVAEQVMRMPEPQVSNEMKISKKTAANPIQRKCPGCKLKDDKEEKLLQAKENSGSTPEVSSELESGISEVRGGGQPLPDSVRDFFEPRFGRDFSSVRVHTNAQATDLTRSVNAQAFTIGQDLVFGAGQYELETTRGKKLLAHELTHVVQQQSGEIRSKLQRVPDEQPEISSKIGMTVSINGLYFQVPNELTYKPGRRTSQLLAIALRRLLGSQYKPGLEHEVEAELSKTRFLLAGGFLDSKPAKGGEPIGSITFRLDPTLVILNFLKAKKLQVQLSPQQEEMLKLGVTNLNLWADFVRYIKDSNNSLPVWYTRDIFDHEMAQHGKLLHEYGDILERARGGDEEARLSGNEVINKVIDALYGPAMILETIRLDVNLINKDETRGVYEELWQLPQSSEGKTQEVISPPTKLRNLATAVLFLGYIRTQPELARNSIVDAANRIELVKRFGRFTQQMQFKETVIEGTEEIRDQPATANYPAFPSTLSAPQSTLPFDAALGTDHRFHMDVQFPSVYEALGRYLFNWELVRIPDEKIGEPVDVSKLEGDKVTLGEVATVRFSHDTAYAKADIKRVVDEMISDIGPAGVGALELVGANAILRYIGTGSRLLLEIMTLPSSQKMIVFPSPGLYIVRAAMSQVHERNEEVVRAPSVAYYPTLARNPDVMADSGVKSMLAAREKAEQRIKELEDKLNKTGLEVEERRELEALRLSTAPLSKRLESHHAEITKLVAAIKSGEKQGNLEATKKEQENIEKIIALRAKRKIGDAELLTARFVSDLGQTIPLTLEVVDRPSRKNGSTRVYISDSTTPKSGDAVGNGSTREEAIDNGIRQLLESIHGYGRGRVAVALGGNVRTIRIEASLGSILTESVESISTMLSIAAIAAAPFTGGATMVFLVPLGMVGAIPSAYRVIQRLDAGTFELNLENALEIVNIAGSLINLGRLGSTSMRMMRMGKALLIVGFGVDATNGILMGTQLITQIEALSKLPPGERSAALLMLIGQTMISAGVIVGGALAERAQQRRAELEGGKVKGLAEEKSPNSSESAKIPHEKSAEMFDKARIDNDMNRLGKMDPESEARIRADEPLRTALAEQPLAAAAFKKCNTPCYPPDLKPEQVARLDRLLSRLEETGGYDEAALKKYLHKRRKDINKAINQIEGVKNGSDLNAWLEFFNKGGKIEKLPPQGDPKLLQEQRDLAYNFGEEKGREMAQSEKKHTSGFENPFGPGKGYGRYGQGFDDVRMEGPNIDTGKVYICEYKGGDARLSPGQGELDWVIKNIRRLYIEDGEVGKQWALHLAKALREGRLEGVAYKTPIIDRKPQPTIKIKGWTYQAMNLKLP